MANILRRRNQFTAPHAEIIGAILRSANEVVESWLVASAEQSTDIADGHVLLKPLIWDCFTTALHRVRWRPQCMGLCGRLPTTKASGKRYRYYIPKADKRYGYRTSATGPIPADQIEDVVVNLVLHALQSPESVQAVWNHVREQYPEIAEPTVVLAMRRLAEVWKALFPAEQVRLVNLLIERVVLLSDGVDIVWRELGWKELAGELAPDTIGGETLEVELAE